MVTKMFGAAGALALTAGLASAAGILQIDINVLQAQSVDTNSNNVAFGGVTHTGSIVLSSGPNSALAGILLNSVSQSITPGQLASFSGVIDLVNGGVTGGSQHHAEQRRHLHHADRQRLRPGQHAGRSGLLGRWPDLQRHLQQRDLRGRQYRPVVQHPALGRLLHQLRLQPQRERLRLRRRCGHLPCPRRDPDPPRRRHGRRRPAGRRRPPPSRLIGPDS